jgi:pimeloyl-ACP methyl ester carboxylesterase
LTSSSGFFVVAPNLLGHARRRGSDYSASTLAEDLRPYFGMNTSYDVIIGHSLGGVVALSLLPFLPKGKEATVILVDPALEIPDGQLAITKDLFLKEVTSPRTPDEHMTLNPAWSRSDCTLRTLGLSMCDRIVIERVFEVNLWT